MDLKQADSCVHHLVIVRGGHQWHFRFTRKDAAKVIEAAQKWASDSKYLFNQSDVARVSSHVFGHLSPSQKNEELI